MRCWWGHAVCSLHVTAQFHDSVIQDQREICSLSHGKCLVVVPVSLWCFLDKRQYLRPESVLQQMLLALTRIVLHPWGKRMAWICRLVIQAWCLFQVCELVRDWIWAGCSLSSQARKQPDREWLLRCYTPMRLKTTLFIRGLFWFGWFVFC